MRVLFRFALWSGVHSKPWEQTETPPASGPKVILVPFFYLILEDCGAPRDQESLKRKSVLGTAEKDNDGEKKKG